MPRILNNSAPNEANTILFWGSWARLMWQAANILAGFDTPKGAKRGLISDKQRHISNKLRKSSLNGGEEGHSGFGFCQRGVTPKSLARPLI